MDPTHCQCYDAYMAAVNPHLEPDPFDKEIEAMLRDPAVVARLDAIAEKRRNGTLLTHSNNEARRIVGLEPEPDEG